MKTLDLTAIEEDMLTQVLKRCLADLEHEIAHTDHAEFRNMLRERHEVLKGIAAKLPVRVTQSA